jgi:uroporphyrinogen-III synthase
MAKPVRSNSSKSPVMMEPSDINADGEKNTLIMKAAKEKPLKDKPVKEKVLKEKTVTAKASAKEKTPDQKKVSSILITQPKPDTDKSPYFELARKYNIDLHFHPFILVEGLSGKDFRKQKVDINEYTAIIFTSRNAVDHFFRICEELKVKVSQEMKYFCITEAVALYLQKFILYRKRKVFFSADGSTQGLLDVIGKHKVEKYILPTAESGKNDIHQYLSKHNITFAEATLFHTVSNNIEGVMKGSSYDMIVFFSPFSVQALFSHDPGFKQNGTLIGAFGPTTAKAIEDSGMNLDVKAPAPNTPSMVSALELFLGGQNK